MQQNDTTPGPWYANTKGLQGIIYSEANGKNVAVSYDVQDAPAIAAAPEALQACQKVLEWARTPGPHGGNPYLMPFVKAALEALEKAGYPV